MFDPSIWWLVPAQQWTLTITWNYQALPIFCQINRLDQFICDNLLLFHDWRTRNLHKSNFRVFLFSSMYNNQRRVILRSIEFIQTENRRKWCYLTDQFPFILSKHHKVNFIKVGDKAQNDFLVGSIPQKLALNNPTIVEQTFISEFKRAVIVKLVFGEHCHVEAQMNVSGIFHWRTWWNVANRSVVSPCPVIAKVIRLLVLVKWNFIVCQHNNLIIFTWGKR